MSTPDESTTPDKPVAALKGDDNEPQLVLEETALPGADDALQVVEVLNELGERPGSEQVFRTDFNKDKHNANTRRTLALGAVGVLIAFYGSAFVAFWLGAFTMEEVTGLIAAFSVIPALASAVFGYYFAKET